MKRRLITLLVLICLAALLLPLTVSAEAPQNGWVKDSGNWYYYQDGNPVTDQVLKIGSAYYGFDYEGIMYDDTDFGYEGDYYRAKPGGTLYVNQWVQQYDEWFYFGAEGKAPNDFTKIGGVWYFFDYGYMCHDQLVWSIDYQGYYVIKPDGTNSKQLTTPGWHQVYGSWYYMYDNGIEICPAQDELKTVGGKTYYFLGTGKMAADGFYYYYDYTEENGYDLLVDKNGYVVENGWAQLSDGWYYVEDFVPVGGGVREIGGNLYAFDENGRLLDTPGEHILYEYDREVYVKNASGVLLRNEWRKIANNWAYYGDAGQRYHEGMYVIGSKMYFFQQGIMLKNELVQSEEGLYYLIDSNGYAAVADGWFQDPFSQNKMYAEDGHLYRGGVFEIDGKVRHFDEEGYLITDSVYEDGYNSYLLDAESTIITKIGWHKARGAWYYVETPEGYLASGWRTFGGTTYYLQPKMAANTLAFNWEDGKWYALNNSGAATALSGTGWREVDHNRFYLENGKPLQNTWKQIGKDWYYFAYDGVALRNGVCEINRTLYLFDWDGKWVENGWYQDMYAKNGQVLTGLQTIGGKQYLFDENGRLFPFTFAETDDGTIYWLNGDSSVKTTLKAGWNQIGSKWYYYDVERGSLLQNTLLWDKNDKPLYGFGSDYAMCTNGIQYAWYDYYMFDASGNLLTGWHKFDGKWYYADPEAYDPMIYNDGAYYINDADYYFKDGYMQVGTLVTEEGIITTNASGAITGHKPLPNGYTYVDGAVIYIQNGQRPTGWVGNYYFEDGYMKVNEVFEHNGKSYFAGKDGQYVRGRWVTASGYGMTVSIYAKADGVLCYNEWLQQGSTWYYFSGVRMAADEVIEIDGQYHRFDASGKWLGQLPGYQEPAAMSDGWHQISGKWYYYHAGRPVNGRQYIGGVWYCFDNYVMIENGFDDTYYYGAGGAQANYTGWKQIGGKWYYFHNDHTTARSMLRLDGGYYFFASNYDGFDSYYEGAPAMIANQAVLLENALYIFNASGFCAGPETGSGWRQAGADWYYLVNGIPMRDTIIKLGNSYYAFDMMGKMVKNTLWEVQTSADYGYMYFNASGVAVTKTGWLQTSKGWIYIGSNGLVYENGMYKIGNATYSFLAGYWVQ